MKINTFLIFVTIYLLSSSISKTLENKIVFKINNEVITSIDIDDEFKYLKALNPKINNLKDKEILEISKNSIVREKIKEIETTKNFKDTEIPVEYINDILKNIYTKIGIKTLDEFKEYLKNNKIEYSKVLEKIKVEILWNELIFSKFSSKIKINEGKIKDLLLSNEMQFSRSYLISEIIFEAKDLNEIDSKYKKIQNLINERGFGNAALTYSISSTSNIGGNLGWINEKSLNSNLRKVLSRMNENEFTDPITVPGGFLILKINKIKKEKINYNVESELKKIIQIKKNNQLNQFSTIYFNKVKKDISINEL
jgi:peptidyl-prolyl cis-trans isomerase SurA